MLDYRLLEALAAVADCGGFERAATRLHLTQSAVSQRVKQLEAQAGRALLVRSSPPRPTPAGQRLIAHHRQVRHLEAELDSFWDRDAQTPSLALGVNADSLATWFPPAILPFVQASGAVLDLRTEDQDLTHGLLRDGEVLGCISARAEPLHGCRVTPLGAMDYVAACTPEFAARWFPRGLTGSAMDDVARAPAALFNRKDEMHARLLAKVYGTVPEHPRHYVPSSEGVVEVLLAGLGYGPIPWLQAREHLDSGRLVDLSPHLRQPIALYWHCWSLDSRLLRDVTEALVAGAREYMA